ncbi:MAG: M28 family peptidase [Myxococcales bacterium]|nr:M28 family peptidase [Myxococcales bacterium]
MRVHALASLTALICACGYAPHHDFPPATGTGAETDVETEGAGTTAAPEPEPVEFCARPLVESIDAETLRAHLDALAQIATEHEGHRAAGSAGYTASLEYVAGRLEAAGYVTARVPFEYPDHVLLGPPLLELTSPDAVTFAHGPDYEVIKFSGAGDVLAPVQPVALALDPEVEATSGCSEEDFEGFPVGAIALLQRGGCTFGVKAERAEAAGAAAVVIFNSGADDNTQAPLATTLGSSAEVTVPTIFTSFAAGVTLATAAEDPAAQLHIVVDGERITAQDDNLIAEHPRGDPEAVIMLGAHLDSVPAGPGINDNGTGSATVLAIAEAAALCEPTRALRFAWWGAEELGLWGSTRYVESLDEEARARLVGYLNFDMVGSPNHVRFVYTSAGAPPGSAAIEALFQSSFAARDDVPTQAASLGGRSDYFAFQQAGVPVGGLFTGAGTIKTADQVALYGGEADVALDPCYHQACDTLENVDEVVLLEMARAAAEVTETLASDTTPLLELAGRRAPSRSNLAEATGAHDERACGHAAR